MITLLAAHSKNEVYLNKLASMLEGQCPVMRQGAELCSHPAGVLAAAGAQSCPFHPCNSPYETDTPEITSTHRLVYSVVTGKSAMSANSMFDPPSLARWPVPLARSPRSCKDLTAHPAFTCLSVQVFLVETERETREETSWGVCVTWRNNMRVQADMEFISEDGREKVTVREGLGLRG